MSDAQSPGGPAQPDPYGAPASPGPGPAQYPQSPYQQPQSPYQPPQGPYNPYAANPYAGEPVAANPGAYPGYPGQPAYPGQPGYPGQPDTLGFGPAQGSYPPGSPASYDPVSGYPISGYPASGYPYGAPPKKRRGPMIAIITLVAALVAGGGAFAVAKVWYGWGTKQAEDVLPASASLFARVDLSPGLGQKLNINSLAEKFPRPDGSTEDFVEGLEKKVFENLGLDLNYRTDIQPWFDGRIGGAMWDPPSGQERCGLIAMASKDDAKAKVTLDKVRKQIGADEFGYAFNDGYAIVAGCDNGAQAAAEAAVAAAKSQSLSGNKAFAEAVDGIPGGQTILVYANLNSLKNELEGLLEEALPDSGPVDTGELTGQILIGAKATGDGVDIHMIANGQKKPAQIKDIRESVANLPGNSIVAGALSFGDYREAFDKIKQSLNLESEFGAKGTVILDGIEALLNSVVTVSLSGLEGDVPPLQIVSQSTGGGDAEKIAKGVEALLSEAPSDVRSTLDVDRSGNQVKVTLGDFSAGSGGRLGDLDLYKEATDGGPDQSVAIFFVNMEKIVNGTDLGPEAEKYLKPIKAVGISSGYTDDSAIALIRVVIK